MAVLSEDSVSAADYVTKRDWRRVADVEIRREGYVPFRPNVQIPEGFQPWPQPPPYSVAIAGHVDGLSAASGALSLADGLTGTSAGLSTTSGLGTLVAPLDIYSAQFINPDSLNQPNLESGGRRFAQNTSWTIAGWILLENRLSESYVASQWIGGGNENWFFGFYYPTFNRWYCDIRDPTNATQALYGPTLVVNNQTWHFVALVHDQANHKIRIYTDGLEAEMTSVGNRTTGGSSIAFGMRAGLGNFSGRLDQWGLWTRALTRAELDAIYNAGVPVSYPSLSAAQLVDMASWLGFKETTLGTSGIDGSQYLIDIGKSEHPGGWDFANTPTWAGGVIYGPYVSHANRATLYP